MKVLFFMLINVKMPTVVGILTFMSRINFVLSKKVLFIMLINVKMPKVILT